MNFSDHREGVVVVHTCDGKRSPALLGAAAHLDGRGVVIVIGMETLH